MKVQPLKCFGNSFPDEKFFRLVLKEREKQKKAFVASFFLPGIGQLILGNVIAGIAFLFLTLFFAYYFFLISNSLNYGSLTAVFAFFGFYILQIVDIKRFNKFPETQCSKECPAGIPVPVVLKSASEGLVETTWANFATFSPFVYTLGAVCYQFCKKNCPEDFINVSEIHKICALEVLESAKFEKRPPLFPEVNYKVAIVGGGVCGLTCGFFLSSCGVKTHVYEKEESLGGIVKLLPKVNKKVFQKEIAYATAFKTLKVFLNSDVSSLKVLKDYDAIVIATGLGKPKLVRGTKLPVVDVVSFLKQLGKYRNKKVGIVGSGDSAFECGIYASEVAKEVFIFPKEIKAKPFLVEKALKKKVKVVSGFTSGKEISEKFDLDLLVSAIGFEFETPLLFEKSNVPVYRANSQKELSTVPHAVTTGRKLAEKVLKDLSLSSRIWFGQPLIKSIDSERREIFQNCCPNLCRECV